MTMFSLFAQTPDNDSVTWVERLNKWLEDKYFGGDLDEMTGIAVVVLGTVIIAFALQMIARAMNAIIVRPLVRRTPTKWDDFLVERKLFTRLSHLVPAAAIYLLAPLYTRPFFSFSAEDTVQQIAISYMIFVGALVVSAFLNAAADIYDTLEKARKNPIKGFVQSAKILIWIVAGIFMAAQLTGRDPWGVVAGIGAITAVVMLVFKDTILGLVASVQIFVNDLVNVGDWIEMPKYGADGDVLDITLTTVKVQNWDMTVTTIPTYAMISDSFKNWRGMTRSGGRRIKRAIHIDMNTIRFCDEDMLARFHRFSLIAGFLDAKWQDIDKFNAQHEIDASIPVNGRRLTNIGVFRAYIKEFLKKHPDVHHGMTFLVRQLPSTDRGLPIEIYVFSRDTAWVNYEEIQADIFDHFFAVLSHFDLAVFQNPTGNDLRLLGGRAA
jgi:miniconductance mechanosensitive channel